MIDEPIFDFILAIYSIIIAIIFGIMYRKRGSLFLWALASILNAIAAIFFYLRYFDPSYRIVCNIFYFFAALLFSVWVFKEYYKLFINKKESIESNLISKNMVFFFTFSLIMLNFIQAALIVYLFINLLMLFRIYLMKRSITTLFMLLVLISAIFTLFVSILSNINVKGAWEASAVIKIIYYTSLLAAGLSAPIEDRMNKSERKYYEAYYRAEFYKDLFAHDISNILQNIQASMDLFTLYSEKPNEIEESKKLINLTKQQVKRGSNLISNVRKLSEIEEIEIPIKPIEICEVLKDVIEYVKKNFEERKLEIKIESISEKVFAKANELLLNVFENILGNAVKYNNNPYVEILIKISNLPLNGIDYVKIEFLDNGIGIPDEMKEKVFERAFMREKSVSGMGLGLSLVKKIIDKYKGNIWVEDKVEGEYSKGTNFIIIIPQVK
ncbi:MAG: HAMP domain-containing histidine kinase [Promethearchaeota archaeon]|nr:MAG: HAMP domain-containing histidine kinase [Candidatus Lokiarchaeota archaeon]